MSLTSAGSATRIISIPIIRDKMDWLRETVQKDVVYRSAKAGACVILERLDGFTSPYRTNHGET